MNVFFGNLEELCLFIRGTIMEHWGFKVIFLNRYRAKKVNNLVDRFKEPLS